MPQTETGLSRFLFQINKDHDWQSLCGAGPGPISLEGSQLTRSRLEAGGWGVWSGQFPEERKCWADKTIEG